MSRVTKLCGLLLLLLAHTGYATAATCGELSPLYIALGERYFELDSEDKQKPPAHEKLPAALVEFLTNAHYSSGTGQRTECKLINGEAAENTINFDLEKIQVSTRKDEVVISATEMNSREQREHVDSIAIPLQTEHLELIGKNQVNVSKQLRHYGASGSYLEEIQLQGTDNNGQLEIKQWRYVNGELADWMSWVMNP